MSIKILINAIDPEECRVAIVKAKNLEEFYIESASREITQGNIYKGTISRIEPSLQAVLWTTVPSGTAFYSALKSTATIF